MKTNCKLVDVPSGIANAAQPSQQNNWHIPLNGDNEKQIEVIKFIHQP